MNARIKDKKEPNNFKPFTLEIDVDTLDELKYLWMMFNLNVDRVIDLSSDGCIDDIITDINKISISSLTSNIWDMLENKLNEELNK